MCGDMKGVYAVLKDPSMVNALMETVQEEMVWTPEMGMSSEPLSDNLTVNAKLEMLSVPQACGR